MQRAGSARRTHVPETTLTKLFESPSRPTTATRQCAAVAVQCNPTSTLALSDALLLQSALSQSGVLTTEHARDKVFIRIMMSRFLFLIQELEARTRLEIVSQRQETYDVITALHKVVPVATSCPPGQQHHHPGAGEVRDSIIFSGELGDIFPTGISPVASSAGMHGSAVSPAVTSFTPVTATDEGQVDELRRRVRLLELRTQNSFHHYSISSQRPVQPPRNLVSLATFALKQMVALQHQCELTRACVLSEERACRSYIVLQVDHVQLAIKERDARRTLLHVPFTSYRPKIPIENSLAGEEFLRRWLLVETLQHYEDNGVLLQQWENCQRNAIEDEEQLTFEKMFPEQFLPVYCNLANSLEVTVASLSAELEVMRKKCDIQRNAAYLDVIVDEETRMRAVVLQSETEATQLLRVVMAHMESVTMAAGKAQRLQEELARQRKRHNGEMRALAERVQRAEQESIEAASLLRNESASWVPSPPPALSSSTSGKHRLIV